MSNLDPEYFENLTEWMQSYEPTNTADAALAGDRIREMIQHFNFQRESPDA